jgi:pyruvate dehydrogenase E1 component alpha subunit
MISATSSTLDFASSPINRSLTPARKIELFTQMVRIRRFEQAALKYYNGGKMGGFLHLYIGQEAVAVGTISLGGADDHFITAYRDHGHALAVGMGMNECMAEMYGKQTGCSKGKGGSMHFFAPDKNFWGGPRYRSGANTAWSWSRLRAKIPRSRGLLPMLSWRWCGKSRCLS